MANRVALWVSIAFLAGFAVAWLTKPAERDPERDDTQVSPGLAARQVPDVPDEAITEVARRLKETPSNTPDGEPVPELVEPLVLRGNGVIQGTVKTKDGDPVAGVLIQADLNDPSMNEILYPSAGKALEADDELRRMTKALKHRRAARRTATTKGDGTYTLSGLVEGAYRISASRDGYELRAARGANAWRATIGTKVDFTARAAMQIKVQVLLSNGAPANRASIELLRFEDRGRGPRYSWSPEHATVAFDLGVWSVTATAREDPGATSAAQTVRCIPGEAPPELTFHLGSAPGLRGRVAFPEGMKAERVDVVARRYEGAEPPTYDRQGRRGWTAARVDDGVYHFSDIVPGRYAIVALVGNAVQLEAAVEVVDRLVEHDLELPAPDMSAYAKARITGPDGEPLERLRFGLSVRTARGSVSAPLSAVEGGAGIWWLDLKSVTRLGPSRAEEGRRYPTGAYTLRVTHRTYGQIVYSFDPNEEGELRLSFAEPFDALVRFRGLAREGLADKAGLYLSGKPDPTGISLSGGRQAVGEMFHLPRVQPGRVYARLVYIEGRGAERVYRTLAYELLELDPDNAELEFALPTLHKLEVTVPKREGGTRVGLHRVDPENTWTHSWERAPERTARFEHIPAGRYRVELRTSEGKDVARFVNIPADKRVTLD